MDEFVRLFLTKWKFTDLIETFKDEEVDEEGLLCLGDNELERLIPKAGPRAKFKKRLAELQDGAGPSNQEEPAETNPTPVLGASWMPHEDLPSSSTAHENDGNVTKRKLDPQPEKDTPVKIKRLCNNVPGSFMGKDDVLLGKVKGIMGGVHDRLSIHENTKLNAFLRNKIWDLCTDKRDLVGVFGKTGAGKSSLINAIVEEKDLLPTGSLLACTTVMIKVEANTQNEKYEAEIEFISKEEWKDELWSLKNLFREIPEEERKEDEEYTENIEKITAIYGDEWKDRSPENLMEAKYFKEIPEFLRSGRKIIQVESAQELAAKVLNYTRSDNNDRKRWFWPLVKCVTLRVPNNDLLKHVTLVDLPGNGDRNKSRDQMWKKVVASCSNVWIVSEMNRPAADKDAWEILESTCNLMGNGGECQNIYFICTKCDAEVDDCYEILKRNMEAKYLMRKEFNKLPKVKKQFKDDSFEVFTVSSKEFFKKKKMNRDDTEIPKLQECLQNLNDQHDQTLNYVYGAYGILSLIQGAKLENVDSGQTAQLCEILNGVVQRELQKVKKSMDHVRKVFENCLSNGVEDSKNNCELALHKKLNPKIKGGGRSFHRPLRCVMQNNGIHKTKKKNINLNETISSFLTNSIDEEFRKTFPNDAKSGPFYGEIYAFSLHTNELIQQFKNYELQLTFIKTEVNKVKTKLCKDIRDRKKIIYSSLAETVKETMEDCYKEAAEFRGPGSLEKTKHTVENHLRDVKDSMFDRAKAVVLDQLKDLMDHVQKQLGDTLQESIELSLKADDQTIPDFQSEFKFVKKYLDDLIGQNEEDLAWPDLFD